MKVQAEVVERKLFPLIAEPFLITKRRDEKFGEIVVLLLEREKLSAQETEKYKTLCASALQKYECPRLILCVNKLPQTATGKPARAEAERLANG